VTSGGGEHIRKNKNNFELVIHYASPEESISKEQLENEVCTWIENMLKIHSSKVPPEAHFRI
jgi:hypothetical protein